MPDRSFKRTWERAHRHERELLRDVETAHKANQAKKAAFATIRYLRSHDACLVATVAAYRKMPTRWRPALENIPVIAKQLDLWEACDEDVHVKLKPKRSNPHEPRMIMRFGIRHRARQYLLAAPLAARSNLSPKQYLTHGGLPAAINTVKEALKAGYRHVTEIDISNCFDSFDPLGVLNLLPLPKEVIAHTVLPYTFNLKPYPDDPSADDFEAAEDFYAYLEACGVQWGIPQGSAISSLVAEVLLGPAISQLPNCGVVVGYADNALLMARSNDVVVSMQKSLLGALKTHPAGPLMPNKPKHYGPNEAVEFLGHRVEFANGAVRVRPSDENLERFYIKFKREVSRLTRHPDAHRLWRLRAFVRSWSGAFKLWSEVEKHCSHHLKMLDDLKARREPVLV